MTRKKPMTAVVLLVLGGLFVLVESGVMLLSISSAHIYPILKLSMAYLLFDGIIVLAWLPSALCGASLIVCGLMANSTDVSRVKVWSIFGMFLSFFSIAVALGGFFLGFVFAFAGSIVGIKYEGR